MDKDKVSVRCSVCSNDNCRKMHKKNGFSIVRCMVCGHVYVNPRLDFDRLEKLYNENKISPMPYYVENQLQDEKTFSQRLGFVEKYAKKGRLLDVGCAVGTFMKVAAGKGWDVCGIDLNRTSVRRCKDHGMDVQCSRFEKHRFKNDYFDAIIMNDFLEHVPEPKKTLKTANKLLKKGGVIFIVTPKISSFIGRISGKYWLHLKPDEHIHFFSKKNLSAMLEEAGFSIIKFKDVGRVRSLKIIIEKLSTYGKLLSRMIKLAIPDTISKNIWINLNLKDEMGVIARKR